jgi:hypothetical protein
MRCTRNEVIFDEGGDGSGAPPWRIWMGDLFVCDRCGAEVIAGVGKNPIANHTQGSLEALKAAFASEFYVSDG